MHHVGTIPAKALLVERFDEGRKRQFPGLLVGVIELSELFGIHAKLARHLNMSVRQAVAFAGGDPSLQVIGAWRWLGYPLRVHRRYASIHSAPAGTVFGSGRWRMPIFCRFVPRRQIATISSGAEISMPSTVTGIPSISVSNGRARLSPIIVANPIRCSYSSCASTM